MFNADGYLKKPYAVALLIIYISCYLGMLVHAIYRDYQHVQAAYVKPNR